jgi:hypothetical protein
MCTFEQARDFGGKVRAYYGGKEYHPEQGKMISTWIQNHVKAEELEPMFTVLVETYSYRGILPLVHDFLTALEKHRATAPRKATQSAPITAQEIKVSEKLWGQLMGKIEKPEPIEKVPRELAEVSLEDYRNFKTDFDLYLTHKAVEPFCQAGECKSPNKGFHYTWKQVGKDHFFTLRRCNAWKN